MKEESLRGRIFKLKILPKNLKKYEELTEAKLHFYLDSLNITYRSVSKTIK